MVADRQQQRAAWALLAPFTLGFVIFTLYPLVRAMVLATQHTFGPGYSSFVGLAKFQFLLSDPSFWRAVQNTALFAAGSVFIQLPVALLLAIALNRPGLRGRAVLRLIFFSPSLVGVVFVALMFAVMLEKRTGLLNVALSRLSAGLGEGLGAVGLGGFPLWDIDFPWLQRHVMSALVITALWMYAGFNMIYFLAALQNVPKDQVEAATIDGAGPLRRFLVVTLPAIRPVAGFVVLLSIIGSFQLFELPFIMLTGPGPENRGLMIVTYLYQKGFELGDLGLASATGWVLGVILMIFAGLQRWSSYKQEADL